MISPKITVSIVIWNPMDAEPSSWPHVTAWLHCAARNTPLQTWDVPSQCLKMLWNRELSSENAEETTRKTGFGKKWLPKIDPWKVRMEARKWLWKMVFWLEKASWLPWTSVLRPTSSNLRIIGISTHKNHLKTIQPQNWFQNRDRKLNNCQARLEAPNTRRGPGISPTWTEKWRQKRDAQRHPAPGGQTYPAVFSPHSENQHRKNPETPRSFPPSDLVAVCENIWSFWVFSTSLNSDAQESQVRPNPNTPIKTSCTYHMISGAPRASLKILVEQCVILVHCQERTLSTLVQDNPYESMDLRQPQQPPFLLTCFQMRPSDAELQARCWSETLQPSLRKLDH